MIHEGGNTALIVGCGHCGIVNIMDRAKAFSPRICVGGYHLYNPLTKKTVPDALLDQIAAELLRYSTQFYTCHCTGPYAFCYLSQRTPNLSYLSCGEHILL